MREVSEESSFAVRSFVRERRVILTCRIFFSGTPPRVRGPGLGRVKRAASTKAWEIGEGFQLHPIRVLRVRFAPAHILLVKAQGGQLLYEQKERRLVTMDRENA